MVTDNEIIDFINNHHSEERICHIKGVVKSALKIAKREGLSVEKVRKAALLHDIAKYLTEEELLDRAGNSSWEIDSCEKSLPCVLHAPVGADIAKKKFKVNDRHILEAIRYHSIGHPRMGKLALIIFVADMIEPNRNFPGVDILRAKAKKALYASVIAVCDHSLKYNIDKKRIVHPNTLLLRNKYIRGKLDAEIN